jgi:hypothetical protein
MKKNFFYYICALSAIALIKCLFSPLNEAKDISGHFIEPASCINYADYHYVGAHNAHVYPPFFSTIAQQDQTIHNQLAYGIRGFMLDTYDFNLKPPATLNGPTKIPVCLSHGNPGLIAYTQKGNRNYQSLEYELIEIINFMKTSPKAIITICLEDYANSKNTVAAIKAAIKHTNYDPILKPKDWSPANNTTQQVWPTLGWMRKNNKRLIIFTQNNPSTDITWHQYTYITENQYSTTDKNQLYTQRSESIALKELPRAIVIFNNFRSMFITRPLADTKKQADREAIQELISFCKDHDFANKKTFNGYFADRIIDSCNALYQEGKETIFEYVNKLNEANACL